MWSMKVKHTCLTHTLYFWKILVSIDVIAVKKVLNKASYRNTNKIDNLKVQKLDAGGFQVGSSTDLLTMNR